MPDNTPPENDPFADLYGRLPDPRGSARAGEAPPSRRAAREARRAETAAADGTGTPPSPRFDAARRAPEEVPPRRTADADTPGAAAPAPMASEPSAPATPEVPLRADTGRDDASARTTPASAPAQRRDGGASRETETRPAREPALVGAGAAAAGASASGNAMASGSLEQLFTGQTTTHDIGFAAPQPSRKRRRVGGWIALGVVLLLVGGIAGGGMALWNTYGERVQAFFGGDEPVEYEAGQATGETRVTIVAGDTGASVSPKMFEAGVTKAADSLYKYMVDNSVVFTFQPGVYKLQQQMTSEAALAALRLPENRLNYSVQLREGLTLAQSLDLISEQLGIARTVLDAAVADPSQYGVPASTLEGWIFPATYDFDEGVTAQQVIDTMVRRTVQSLDAAGVPESDRGRILIIASIIEREAPQQR
ncbi:endolytic transglycosylase MltG [Microbacterium sp. SORGH_AS_0344]|uniref:endolytic transglycosylase MltG n=1 Tax=Microbacterium sp. SORGH_AS_0344 TaxID=3041767 RepID=UPI002782D417|nr:endolytic transglycosylase MltG [Microbacterium sp. SORGH_AS_0344]MDQ1084259.1 UPF0755 protein [Microbacterium sp. SORGH_AS_0344]